jgi:hypothetical protein
MDQTNPLFAYLMAHPLTANTAPVSSIGEGAARVGQGALGGMNNMLMAQLMMGKKAPPKTPLDPAVMPSTSSIDRMLDPSLGSLFGMGGP